jgi:hypothetical protein
MERGAGGFGPLLTVGAVNPAAFYETDARRGLIRVAITRPSRTTMETANAPFSNGQ